ncbi:MAG: MBL fold metallo-hydrolase [Xanthomonadales bacterium]|nr:MBL fold metallo-hydrolase [Xanthomonadales bacterium]MCC6562396.1 MBL fold metallo-hydrolase [Xanthomonadales bacterium]
MDTNGSLALRFLGVGNAQAVELGSAAAVLERDGAPLLLIDCGPEAFTAYLTRYGALPRALFITHAHFDHIGGLERLFYRAWFDPGARGAIRLYAAAELVPILQQRVASYPSPLAEGGVNFWDAFQLIPVDRGFWLDALWFDVFAVRHHLPRTAFGLGLRGSFVYTGDTRPIPELLAAHADAAEQVAHDCGLVGNPSHAGLDDLLREYPLALRARLLVYHYADAAAAAQLGAAGLRVAAPGVAYPLAPPVSALVAATRAQHGQEHP